MKQKIYIVVLVTYDWHRFQKNLYANTNKQKCIEFAKNYKWMGEDKLSIIMTESKSYSKRGNEGIKHLWIQKL